MPGAGQTHRRRVGLGVADAVGCNYPTGRRDVLDFSWSVYRTGELVKGYEYRVFRRRWYRISVLCIVNRSRPAGPARARTLVIVQAEPQPAKQEPRSIVPQGSPSRVSGGAGVNTQSVSGLPNSRRDRADSDPP
jgi:hypothetical protein